MMNLTIAETEMLSDALAQYIENTDFELHEPTERERLKFRLAEMMAEKCDAILAGLAK
jgi:hypothetical protein